LALLDQLRFEGAVAVAGDVDVDLAAAVGQHRLGPLPVAGVGSVAALDGVLVVAEVISELFLDHGLRHRLEQPVRTGQRDPRGSGLTDQVLHRIEFSRTQRPVFSVSGSRRLRWWCAHAHQCVGHRDSSCPSGR